MTVTRLMDKVRAIIDLHCEGLTDVQYFEFLEELAEEAVVRQQAHEAISTAAP